MNLRVTIGILKYLYCFGRVKVLTNLSVLWGGNFFLLVGSRLFPGGLESLDMVWKVSYCSGKFPGGPESLQTSLKVSRWPGMSLIVLESSQTARKASNWS